MKLLLEKGTGAGARDSDGATPLWRAVFRAQPRAVELLLERWVDVNSRVLSSIAQHFTQLYIEAMNI